MRLLSSQIRFVTIVLPRKRQSDFCVFSGTMERWTGNNMYSRIGRRKELLSLSRLLFAEHI